MRDRKILEQAVAIVRDAGDNILLPAFSHVDYSLKPDNSLLTESDIAAQLYICQALHDALPEIKVLGEEMTEDDQRRLLQDSTKELWCLDPLDGTTNFAMHVPYFAISLALLRDREPCLGIVYDPVRAECFSAIAGQGVWLNGAPMPTPARITSLADAVALVDCKRLPPEIAMRLATRPPYRSQRSFGSVALDWCWLAAGRGQVYLHGRQKMWDYAAGSLILRQAGGQMQSLAGDTLQALDLEPRSALAALHTDLFSQWRDCLAQC